jgi:hypothetical protein
MAQRYTEPQRTIGPEVKERWYISIIYNLRARIVMKDENTASKRIPVQP